MGIFFVFHRELHRDTMAAGKNPKTFKKKGNKKKVVDPFVKKEWFRIKAQRLVADNLKGRIFEVCLADLQQDESQFYQNIKLKCQEVQGQDVLTSFHGLDFTTDKKRSLVRK